MDTGRFIQMANRMSVHSVTFLNRRFWWLNLCPQQFSKAFHSNFVEENPYMKKYADKIAGLPRSPTENTQINAKKLVQRCGNLPKHSWSQSCLANQNQQTTGNPFPGIGQKSLDGLMKLEMLKDKTAEEIEFIWKQYFKVKDGVYAVVPAETYHQIVSKSEEFPTFLYPVPKGPGYEFILSQFKGNSCYFVPLQDYQAHKDKARATLTITYYPELVEEKGIVLMRGEFDDAVIKVQEAQCLANQLQLYYGSNNMKKQKLLRLFNKEPHKFQYRDLISELETGLG